MRYSLRDSENKLVVPLPRKIALDSDAALWNSLPCNLRTIKSFNQFKNKVSTEITTFLKCKMRHGIHGKQD